MAGKANHRGFGYVRKLPSKRYQASYVGPDLARHPGPSTFATKQDAEAWLAVEARAIAAGTWRSPAHRAALTEQHTPTTVGEYAESWMSRRDLRPRTRAHYRSLLDRLIFPTFSGSVLVAVTPRQVADWHHKVGTRHPTLRAHAYGLLKAIYSTAVMEDECPTNPCRVRGAGTVKRARQVRPASLDELAALVAAMPPRFQLMTLVTAWCALRFGEVTELRRSDVDLTDGVLRIRRAVVRADGEVVVGPPKTDAGRRDVAIPPHLVPMIREHLAGNITGGRHGLLFPAAGDPSAHLAPASLYRGFYPARDAAGRPDLRWHDLRHTGAVLAASTGATLAELMGRLGHSTPAAAMRYQHASAGRDAQIAAALSALARGGPT